MKLRLVIAAALIFPSLVFAQGVPDGISGLEITASNNNPAPGQEVTLTARSYTIDINSASLTWTVDGKTVAKGIGATVIKVTAPAMGKTVNVSLSAVTQDGASLQETLRISSGSVDMIVETDGHVPPMFPGKLMPTYQNRVKIIAVPHLAASNGVEYDPKTLVYRWEQGGNAIEGQSGYGRQSITIPGTIIPRPYLVSVTVSTRDGSVQGEGIVSVSQNPPVIGFYRNDPLYGPLYNNAVIDTIYMGAQREAGMLAVPFGFNLPGGLSDLEIKWLINSRERTELAQNQIITLRAPDGAAGTSDISISIRSKKNILQQSGTSFRAIFNAIATSTPLNF